MPALSWSRNTGIPAGRTDGGLVPAPRSALPAGIPALSPARLPESELPDDEPLPAEQNRLSEYRNPDAFRGLEDYSHIWLIWEFSQAVRQKWSPTVRPPRLGGNVRMGVFATRSPFRPNSLGLSVVQLEEITLHGANAPYLTVSGADLMHGTPIYDIKPYLPHIDSHPEARACSF